MIKYWIVPQAREDVFIIKEEDGKRSMIKRAVNYLDAIQVIARLHGFEVGSVPFPGDFWAQTYLKQEVYLNPPSPSSSIQSKSNQ